MQPGPFRTVQKALRWIARQLNYYYIDATCVTRLESERAQSICRNNNNQTLARDGLKCWWSKFNKSDLLRLLLIG